MTNSQKTSLLRVRPAAVSVILLSAAACTLVIATGCGKMSKAAAKQEPLEVQVTEVRQRDVPIYKEWIGTLDGFVNADIKAQVSGYLIRQTYVEGSFVRSGQLLFQIDPMPFQADLGQLEQATAQLAQAEAQVAVAVANQRRVQLDEDRYTPLAREQAITQQDLDNATQNNMAAKAQLQAAKAQVETDRAQITAAVAAVQSAKAAVETAR